MLVGQRKEVMFCQTLQHSVEVSGVMCHSDDIIYIVHCQLCDASFHCYPFADGQMVSLILESVDDLFSIHQTSHAPPFVRLMRD